MIIPTVVWIYLAVTLVLWIAWGISLMHRFNLKDMEFEQWKHEAFVIVGWPILASSLAFGFVVIGFITPWVTLWDIYRDYKENKNGSSSKTKERETS